MAAHGSLPRIDPNEYLIHLDVYSLMSIYFVNKYFQQALESKEVLKMLEKEHNLAVSHSFKELVDDIDVRYLTQRSKKYLLPSKLIKLAFARGDITIIH